MACRSGRSLRFPFCGRTFVMPVVCRRCGRGPFHRDVVAIVLLGYIRTSEHCQVRAQLERVKSSVQVKVPRKTWVVLLIFRASNCADRALITDWIRLQWRIYTVRV